MKEISNDFLLVYEGGLARRVKPVQSVSLLLLTIKIKKIKRGPSD